jgi:formate hydrogenlyase subunit 3/multisubunit Na+/H+ antiporter MnhD subunit
MVPPIVVMATATVVIGLFGEPLFRYTERAAAQLLDAEGYQAAVLLPVEAPGLPIEIEESNVKGFK